MNSYATDPVKKAKWWLPQELATDLDRFESHLPLERPIDLATFLKIITKIDEQHLDDSVALIHEAYEKSEFRGALFLLLARVYLAKGEYQLMTTALDGASQICEDQDLLARVLTEFAGHLKNSIESENAFFEGQLETKDRDTKNTPLTHDKGSCVALSDASGLKHGATEWPHEKFNDQSRSIKELCFSGGRSKLHLSEDSEISSGTIVGCCIGSLTEFNSKLKYSTELPILATVEHSSIANSYNNLLDRAISCGAGILVLAHEDTIILDTNIENHLSNFFEKYPNTAIAGVVGADSVAGLAWWNGSLHGAITEGRGYIKGSSESFEGAKVDAVDGCFLVLNLSKFKTGLRFDTTYPGYHGYDVDLCFQACRTFGFEVRLLELRVHHSSNGPSSMDSWMEHEAIFQKKWFPSSCVARVIHPSNYPYSKIFDPVATALELDPVFRGKRVVLGAHLTPTGTFHGESIFNFEQLGQGWSSFHTPQYEQLLSDHPVIDYSQANRGWYEARDISNVEFVHIGKLLAHHPAFTFAAVRRNWTRSNQSNLKIGFVGSMSSRRQAKLSELKAAGFEIFVLNGLFGIELYKRLLEIDVLLNIHYDIPANAEVLRIVEGLFNGCIILTENNHATNWLGYEDLKSMVLLSKYEEIADKLCAIKNDLQRVRQKLKASCLLKFEDWFCSTGGVTGSSVSICSHDRGMAQVR